MGSGRPARRRQLSRRQASPSPREGNKAKRSLLLNLFFFVASKKRLWTLRNSVPFLGEAWLRTRIYYLFSPPFLLPGWHCSVRFTLRLLRSRVCAECGHAHRSHQLCGRHGRAPRCAAAAQEHLQLLVFAECAHARTFRPFCSSYSRTPGQVLAGQQQEVLASQQQVLAGSQQVLAGQQVLVLNVHWQQHV